MSSGGSSNQQSVSFDQKSIEQFQQTDLSKEFTQAQLKALNGGVVQQDNKYYASSNDALSGSNDVTNLVNTFTAWQAANASTQKTASQYAQISAGQPGRDATILTGPEQTLLAGPYQRR